MRSILRFISQHFGRKEWAALTASILLIILVGQLLAKADNLESLGYAGGFLAMLFGSATVILPAPGIAVVAALGTTVSSPLLLGIISGFGAALGEIIGYLAGYGGHKIIEDQKHYPSAKSFFEKYGFWAIAILAFIPNPLFDIAGMIAGSTKYPFSLFMYATAIGKIFKCILIAYLGAATSSWLGS